jgi:hypothetical protein
MGRTTKAWRRRRNCGTLRQMRPARFIGAGWRLLFTAGHCRLPSAVSFLSFALHCVAGRVKYNDEAREHGAVVLSLAGYFGSSTFWFESFQNWQSEFLSVGALVVLSIFLRQKGSPESKPVHAAHAETGA